MKDKAPLRRVKPPVAAVLMSVAVLLAGCSGGEEETNDAPSRQECEAQGLELRTENGTLACREPLPPASVSLEGVPDTTEAYRSVAFSWVLEAPGGSGHAMLTQVRVRTASAGVNASDPPEAYGIEVARKEHQDFQSGARYDAAYESRVAGTFYFRAYALVNQTHIWSEEVVLEVTEVQPTGETGTVTLPAAAVAQGADPAEITIQLGDTVTFQNDDVLPRTITITGPSEIAAVEVAMQSSGPTEAFLVPGSYTWTSDEPAQPVTGSIQVEAPA